MKLKCLLVLWHHGDKLFVQFDLNSVCALLSIPLCQNKQKMVFYEMGPLRFQSVPFIPMQFSYANIDLI